MFDTKPLTVLDVILLGYVVDIASRGAKIKWTFDSDTIYEGVARNICNVHGGFLHDDVDLRNGYLRVTLLSGRDEYLPVMAAARLRDNGALAEVKS